MTIRRYKGYKDSGVEWLGPVPEHWAVTRLKFIAHVQTGVAKGKDNTGRQTITVPYLRVANVQDGYLDLDEVATIEIPADDLPRYRLRAGDVLMNEGGDFDKLGRGHVWDGSIDPCIHQNHVFAVRPFGVSPQWLNLVTGSAYAQFYFMSRSKQSTNLASISSTNVMELPVVLPPAPEQATISNFLGREVAKIDELVVEQKRLVVLLRERRLAVISNVVTRGLNQRAQMMDTGAHWLGEVPKHWSIRPLMRLTAVGRPIMYGIVLPGPDAPGGVPIVKGGDVRPHRLRLDLLNRTTPEIEAPYARARLLPNDIVYSIRGSIGDAELVPEELDGANITQDAARISPSSEVHPKWLLYAMKSRQIFAQLEVRSLGATIRGINIFDLKRAQIPVPPMNEQKRIAAFVDEDLRQIDELVAQAVQSINVLSERRTALISAAVTGQIDVRDRPSLDTDLEATRAEIAAGRYMVESAAAHVARLQAMASADGSSAPPPAPC